MKKLKIFQLFKIVIPTLILGACTPSNTPSTPVEPPVTISHVEDFNVVRNSAVSAKNYTFVETTGNDTLKTEIDHNKSKVGDKYYTYDQSNMEYWNQDGTWYMQETTYENPLTTYNTFLAGLTNVADAEDGLLTMQDADGVVWTGSVSKQNNTFEISSNGTKYAVSSIGTTQVDVPEAILYVEKTPADIWRETKALALEKGNFTFKTYENGALTRALFVDNDNAKVGDTYYTFGETNYEFNNEDDVWYRSETTQTNPKQEVVTWLNNLTLHSNDIYVVDDAEYLMVKDLNTGYKCYTTADGESLLVVRDEFVWELSDIDNTIVDVPTNWQEKQPQEMTQIVRDDGTYNIKLMKSLVLDWLKGNNAQGKDYITYKMTNFQTEDVLFVNPTDDGLQIGALYSAESELPQIRFALFNIANENISYDSKNAFVDSLYNLPGKKFVTQFYVSGLYANEDTIKQANNILTKMGRTTNAVWAMETDRVSTGFTGFEYKFVLFDSEGTFISTAIGTASKDYVINGTENWTLSNDTTIIETDTENVEQQETTLTASRELVK